MITGDARVGEYCAIRLRTCNSVLPLQPVPPSPRLFEISTHGLAPLVVGRELPGHFAAEPPRSSFACRGLCWGGPTKRGVPSVTDSNAQVVVSTITRRDGDSLTPGFGEILLDRNGVAERSDGFASFELLVVFVAHRALFQDDRNWCGGTQVSLAIFFDHLFVPCLARL